MKSEADIRAKIKELETQMQNTLDLQNKPKKKDLGLIAASVLVLTRNALQIKALLWVLEEKINIP